MQITVTGHGTETSAALRSYATEKLQRMDKYANGINKIQVIFKPAPKEGCDLEAICRVAGKVMVVHGQHQDFYAAVDLVADKLQRQLSKHKSKKENGLHGRKADESRKFMDAATGDAPHEELDDYDLD